MKLNRNYDAPIPLETPRFEGFCVRPLTGEDADAVDAKAAKIENNFEADVFYAQEILCDDEGNAIEGTESVESVDKLVSRGYLRDLVREAKEVLQLGKSYIAVMRRLERTLFSASADTTQTASDESLST